MTYFSELSQTSQNVLMVQFEFFAKVMLIGFFAFLAIYCIFVWKKNQKETPYVLVALIRTMLYALSWIYLYFTPLFVVYLYPQESLNRVLGATFIFYRYTTLIIGILVFINVLFYSPFIIAKLGGLNIMSKNTDKVMDQWLGKYKKYFRRS